MKKINKTLLIAIPVLLVIALFVFLAIYKPFSSNPGDDVISAPDSQSDATDISTAIMPETSETDITDDPVTDEPAVSSTSAPSDVTTESAPDTFSETAPADTTPDATETSDATETPDATDIPPAETASTAEPVTDTPVTSEPPVTAHVHVFGDWKTVKVPTCSEQGMKARECECGETETAPIPSVEHSYNSGVVTKKATCSEAGVKTYTCSVCGHTKTESIPKTAHSYDGGTVTKEPDCAHTGEKIYRCTVCGSTKTEKLDKTAHSFVFTSSDAACGESGTAVYTCTRCGTTKTERVSSSHEWGAPIVIVESDGKSQGLRAHVCKKCGAYEAYIPDEDVQIHVCAHVIYPINLIPIRVRVLPTYDSWGGYWKNICPLCGQVRISNHNNIHPPYPRTQEFKSRVLWLGRCFVEFDNSYSQSDIEEICSHITMLPVDDMGFSVRIRFSGDGFRAKYNLPEEILIETFNMIHDEADEYYKLWMAGDLYVEEEHQLYRYGAGISFYENNVWMRTRKVFNGDGIHNH